MQILINHQDTKDSTRLAIKNGELLFSPDEKASFTKSLQKFCNSTLKSAFVSQHGAKKSYKGLQVLSVIAKYMQTAISENQELNHNDKIALSRLVELSIGAFCYHHHLADVDFIKEGYIKEDSKIKELMNTIEIIVNDNSDLIDPTVKTFIENNPTTSSKQFFFNESFRLAGFPLVLQEGEVKVNETNSDTTFTINDINGVLELFLGDTCYPQLFSYILEFYKELNYIIFHDERPKLTCLFYQGANVDHATVEKDELLLDYFPHIISYEVLYDIETWIQLESYIEPWNVLFNKAVELKRS